LALKLRAELGVDLGEESLRLFEESGSALELSETELGFTAQHERHNVILAVEGAESARIVTSLVLDGGDALQIGRVHSLS